ncbi:MAG: hypothetical protein E6522_07925, partial [Streptococcus vestibularis]|nr:hypothetical protein [Streptococcus vestibularis]
LDGVVEKNKILKNTKVNRFDDNVYLKSVVEQNQHLLKDYDNFMDMLNSGKAKYSNDGYTSTSYISQYNYFKNRPVKTIIKYISRIMMTKVRLFYQEALNMI